MVAYLTWHCQIDELLRWEQSKWHLRLARVSENLRGRYFGQSKFQDHLHRTLDRC